MEIAIICINNIDVNLKYRGGSLDTMSWNVRVHLRVLSCGILCRVVRRKSTDSSKDNFSSIYMVEGYASMKQGAIIVPTICFSTLKMEATYSTETSVDFQRNIRCYRILHNDNCENLISYAVFYYLYCTLKNRT